MTVKSVDFQIAVCCGTPESRAVNALLMGFFVIVVVVKCVLGGGHLIISMMEWRII